MSSGTIGIAAEAGIVAKWGERVAGSVSTVTSSVKLKLGGQVVETESVNQVLLYIWILKG